MEDDSGVTCFDPTHFCPSWVNCCERNLELKKLHDLNPSHPPITASMCLEDAFKVTEAALEIWHSVCGQDRDKFNYVQCLKTILQTPENGRHLIKALNKCQCCQRHQLHRPLSLEDKTWKLHVPPNISYDEDDYYHYYRRCNCPNKHFPKTDYKCDCICRHETRLIQQCWFKST